MLPIVKKYRPLVDIYIQDFINKNSEKASPMASYHMGFVDRQGNTVSNHFDGKGLRPTLVLLTAEALGHEWEKLVPLAGALEIFHNFTLIHDDIQDNDEKRHGKPTVWKAWSMGQGINAGDTMSYLSTLSLLQLSKSDFPAEQILQAAERLTMCGILVIDGQIRDINFEERVDVTVDEYLEMISGKTGALIETAIIIATDLIDTTAEKKKYLSIFGKQIGRTFQIADDILGIWGEEDNTGKRKYGDVIRKKKSLPIILALNNSDTEKVKVLKEIYSQKKNELDSKEVEKIVEIFDSLNIKKEAEKMLDDAYTRSVEAARKASLGTYEKEFVQLADLLAHRNK